MEPAITIINISRNRNPDAIYVGRRTRGFLHASPLANPYQMQQGKDSEIERNRVCEFYNTWINAQIEDGNQAVIGELERLARIYVETGRLILACWCAPKRCHAETIKLLVLEIARDLTPSTMPEPSLRTEE